MLRGEAARTFNKDHECLALIEEHAEVQALKFRVWILEKLLQEALDGIVEEEFNSPERRSEWVDRSQGVLER